MKLELSQQIFEKKKNTQISKFMKIPLVEAELSHVNGRTDMTKLSFFAILPRRLERLKCKHFATLLSSYMSIK